MRCLFDHCLLIARVFTTTDLLIVCAIVAAVGAILLPVFGTMKNRADIDSCAHNEKQLAAAMQSYAQDYDQSLPCGINSSSPKGAIQLVNWASQIYPYVKDASAYKCPSDKSVAEPASDGHEFHVDSYAANSNLSTSGPPNYDANTGFKLSKIASKSATVLFCEVSDSKPERTDFANIHTPIAYGTFGTASNGVQFSDTSKCDSARLVTGVFGDSGATEGTAPFGELRHAGGSNYAFIDGHVHFFAAGDVSAGYGNSNGGADCGAGTGASTLNPVAAAAGCPSFKATFSTN